MVARIQAEPSDHLRAVRKRRAAVAFVLEVIAQAVVQVPVVVNDQEIHGSAVPPLESSLSATTSPGLGHRTVHRTSTEMAEHWNRVT